ncbi:MAG: hypothetical protein GY874_15500 [Desulfobacteraceae bacterium]|nr:hypothetical protein [Desulfobacteraceae bacterium]
MIPQRNRYYFSKTPPSFSKTPPSNDYYFVQNFDNKAPLNKIEPLYGKVKSHSKSNDFDEKKYKTDDQSIESFSMSSISSFALPSSCSMSEITCYLWPSMPRVAVFMNHLPKHLYMQNQPYPGQYLVIESNQPINKISPIKGPLILPAPQNRNSIGERGRFNYKKNFQEKRSLSL